MKWLEILYNYIWFFSEFLVENTRLRRPWTFIMRDRPWIFWCVLTPCFGLLIYFLPGKWWTLWLIPRIILGGFWCTLLGHLWWGTPHIIGEQEEPTFNPLHPVKSIDAIRRKRNMILYNRG